jgi:hypothetical protein
MWVPGSVPESVPAPEWARVGASISAGVGAGVGAGTGACDTTVVWQIAIGTLLEACPEGEHDRVDRGLDARRKHVTQKGIRRAQALQEFDVRLCESFVLFAVVQEVLHPNCPPILPSPLPSSTLPGGAAECPGTSN